MLVRWNYGTAVCQPTTTGNGRWVNFVIIPTRIVGPTNNATDDDEANAFHCATTRVPVSKKKLSGGEITITETEKC